MSLIELIDEGTETAKKHNPEAIGGKDLITEIDALDDARPLRVEDVTDRGPNRIYRDARLSRAERQ